MVSQPPKILVVDDDPAWLAGALELLASAGYLAQGSGSFDEAQRTLRSTQPDLLVTDVRLGEYNGLYLLLRTHQTHPRMAAIVVSGYEDPVLEREARRYGAADFLVKPIDPKAFVTKIGDALARSSKRRWARKDVREDLPALVDGRPARVLNVSYGGVRLELPSTPSVGSTMNIELPSHGVLMKAQPVWTREAAPGERHECGVFLLEDQATNDTWRRVVDGIPA
jgi:FixJ family two-component response regulator